MGWIGEQLGRAAGSILGGLGGGLFGAKDKGMSIGGDLGGTAGGWLIPFARGGIVRDPAAKRAAPQGMARGGLVEKPKAMAHGGYAMPAVVKNRKKKR
jgi:hypothetical protein